MSDKSLIVSIVAIALLVFSSCGNKHTSGDSESGVNQVDSVDFNYPVAFQNAKGIDVVNGENYKIVYIFHPDLPDTIDTYVLYPRHMERPQLIELSDAKVTAYIPIPITNIVCTSSVQVGALPILNREEHLVGVVSIKNINDLKLRALAKEGRIQEVGRGMSKNMERIMALHPDVVLMDFTRTPEEAQKFKDSGIDILLYNSWKEQSLLGRAEWIKFIGMLFGDNKLASEVFGEVTREYDSVKEIVANEEEIIPVMYGQDYKGTWYLPGEFSYVTSMLHDAKLSFDYAEGRVSSLPCSFERIFKNNRDVKVWICVMMSSVMTYKDFIAQNDRYRFFAATQEGGTLVTDQKRVNEYGGNDYWESGPYHPDLILKDLIKITRPYLLPDYETTYFKQLTRQ